MRLAWVLRRSRSSAYRLCVGRCADQAQRRFAAELLLRRFDEADDVELVVLVPLESIEDLARAPLVPSSVELSEKTRFRCIATLSPKLRLRWIISVKSSWAPIEHSRLSHEHG